VNAVHAKTGGGVTYLRGVLPLLAADPELELHLCLHRDQFSIFADLDDRIRIHLFDFRPGILPLLLWEQCALPILARAMGIDVMFSPANFGPLLSRSAVILLRNSLAVVEREARLNKRLYWGALAIATAFSILRSTHTIAVSDYAAKALTRRLPASIHRKISVVHHGVRSCFLDSPPQEQRGSFLLAVADIYIQKNLHTLMDALRALKPRIPGIHIRIAGRVVDEDYFNEISQQIARHDLTANVRFLGPVDQDALIELYTQCRLLVFPSTVETFGHPLVEAMACGTPVVSSNTAAMPEILGDAGLYFDPLNSDNMANAIERLYNDDALRAALGERGRTRAQSFSLASTAQRTGRLLKQSSRVNPVSPL